MAGKHHSSSEADAAKPEALRKQAETILLQRQADRNQPPPAGDAGLHEREVHRIELELLYEELRRTQQKLENSRKRYFDVYDSAPVGYLTISERGLILEANIRAAALLGSGRKDLLQQPLSRFKAPEDGDIYYQIIKKLFSTGEPQASELRMKSRNGEIFWVHVTATAALDFKGTPVCHIVLNNITELKRAEFALRESEQRYRAIMEQAADSVFLHDRTGRIIDVNRKASETLGYSRQELLGLSVADINPEAIRDGNHALWEKVLAGEQFTFEGRHMRKGGSSFPVEVTLSPVLLPQGSAVLGIARDITDRKREEEALRISEARFRSYFDMNLHGIAITSPEKSWLLVNDRVCSMLGYSREEILGRTWVEMTHPDDLAADLEQFNRVLSGQIDHCTLDKRFILKDGSILWTSLGVGCVRRSDKSVDYIVLVLEDITERKKWTGELEMASQKWRTTFDAIVDPVALLSLEGTIEQCNRAFIDFLGLDYPAVRGRKCHQFIHKTNDHVPGCPLIRARESGVRETMELQFGEKIFLVAADPIKARDGKIVGFVHSMRDITERKRLEMALEKRLVALTRPLDQTDSVTFEDLFEIADIQRIQDEFAAATGVASIITQPDGTPITRPSNFCRLCENIIRSTKTGRINCFRSDALIGRHNAKGPTVQPCLSGGLWDAGASITIGDRHIANWLIGQVRDETQSEEKMLEYARSIGADEAAFLAAFREVPAMSQVRFQRIAQALFTLANQLSTTAYQNVQQARFITERKRAEQALQDSASRQQALLDAIPDIIMEVDSNKMYTWANQPGLEFFGDDVIGRQAAYYFEGDQDTYEKIDTLFQGKELTYYIESWQRRRDGQKRLLAWWCRVLKNVQGAVTGTISSARDITEQKQAEQSLNELKLAVEQSRDGIAFADLDGRIRFVNQAWATMHGYTVDELIGCHLSLFHTPAQLEKDVIPFNNYALVHGSKEGEVGHVRKDGIIFSTWMSSTVIGFAGRQPRGWLGIAREITERKQAEDALKAPFESLKIFWGDLVRLVRGT